MLYKGKLTESGAQRMFSAPEKKGALVEFTKFEDQTFSRSGVAHEVFLNCKRIGGFLDFGDPRENPTVGIDITEMTEQVVLEKVTITLRRDTNERLTEAALRQKLKKVVPSTRQDIIEAALQDWFQRHGYAVINSAHTR